MNLNKSRVCPSMMRIRRQRQLAVLVCLWVAGVLVFLVHSFPDVFEPDYLTSKSVSRTSGGHSRSKANNNGDYDDTPLRPPRRNGSRVAMARNKVVSLNFVHKTSDEYFKLNSSKVNKFNAEFIIKNQLFCDKSTPYLLTVVPSIPTHTRVRSAIRATYGSYRSRDEVNNEVRESFRILFFFGRVATAGVDKLVQEENKRHGDIVQLDFEESYSNLTLKMMAILKWVATFCGEVDYVLKADEDVFVNVPILLTQLKLIPYSIEGSVLGHLNSDSGVKRSGKWAVSGEQFPLPTYPPYASGNSYVISGNIVPRMFYVSEYMPYLPIEDVFVTGVLTKLVGANHIPLEGFTFWLANAPDPCEFVSENRTTATKVDPDLMLELWHAQNTYEQICQHSTDAV